MVEGLREPDGGESRILGQRTWPRNASVLPRIGVQLPGVRVLRAADGPGADPTPSRRCTACGADRADAWLERVGLSEKAETRAEQLSGGQLQRLSIACALVHDPERLLFLDEPTAASTRRPGATCGTCSADLNSEGRTMVLTTHYDRRGRGAVRPGGDHGPRPGAAAGRAGGAGARAGRGPVSACPSRRAERASTSRGLPGARRRTPTAPTSSSARARRPPSWPRLAEPAPLEGCRSGAPPSRTSSSSSPAGPSTGQSPHGSRSPFVAIALTIVKGFVRDRASVFFAVVFPLMFLVLFGGIFDLTAPPGSRWSGSVRCRSSRHCRHRPARPSRRPSRSPRPTTSTPLSRRCARETPTP